MRQGRKSNPRIGPGEPPYPQGTKPSTRALQQPLPMFTKREPSFEIFCFAIHFQGL